MKTKLEYLGYVVQKEGIQPLPSKVEVLENFAVPTNIKGIRRFLGLASYYWKLIPDYHKKAIALTRLIRKDNPFK